MSAGLSFPRAGLIKPRPEYIKARPDYCIVPAGPELLHPAGSASYPGWALSPPLSIPARRAFSLPRLGWSASPGWARTSAVPGWARLCIPARPCRLPRLGLAPAPCSRPAPSIQRPALLFPAGLGSPPRLGLLHSTRLGRIRRIQPGRDFSSRPTSSGPPPGRDSQYPG
jgi:hypothetical protein